MLPRRDSLSGLRPIFTIGVLRIAAQSCQYGHCEGAMWARVKNARTYVRLRGRRREQINQRSPHGGGLKRSPHVDVAVNKAY